MCYIPIAISNDNLSSISSENARLSHCALIPFKVKLTSILPSYVGGVVSIMIGPIDYEE